MEKLSGKTLLFTDIHFGNKGNISSRLKICETVIDDIIQAIDDNDVSNAMFLGDYFNSRSAVDVNTMNIGLKCIEKLAKKCKVWMILGNHDIWAKNSVDVNSVNIFKNIENVNVVEKTTEIDLNGAKTLLCPWLYDISFVNKPEFDIIMGHFDVSSKYLIQSYIDNNIKKNVSDKLMSEVDKDISTKTQYVNDHVGTFVDIVKTSGQIYSGHIHTHKEFLSKGRDFIFVGSPYELNLGETTTDHGYYILDESNNRSFYPITNVPRHIDIRISQIMQDRIDSYDFSNVKDNIIHKIYDIEIKPEDDALITQRITDMRPYEELLPDYEVDINYGSTDDVKTNSGTINLIKKSKLEYIRNYITNIDENLLKDQKIDKETLFKIMEAYYDLVEKGC